MKKLKSPIYLRYEFSNKAGKPEGGDIFEYTSLETAAEMISELVEVAHGDGVAINLTIGEKAPFYGFLKNAGMSKEAIESEKVEVEMTASAPQSNKRVKPAAKKTSSKKAAKKTAAKKSSKKR